MTRRRSRCRTHPAAWIIRAALVLLGVDLVAWLVWALLHLLVALAPLVLLVGAGGLAWRHWHPPAKIIRQGSDREYPPPVPLAQPSRPVDRDTEAELDSLHRYSARLEAENVALRQTARDACTEPVAGGVVLSMRDRLTVTPRSGAHDLWEHP